ncbi:MAG: alkane 1-monooxygenase [Saprospiraceae bacterium]|nr:alkane 1-monooxygenase [Saprospiraceae bacterium]
MRDLKYLAAFIVPLTAFISLYLRGPFAFSTLIFVFVCVPLLEPILPKSASNLNADEANAKSKNIFFELLLYLNIPIVFGLLFYFLSIVSCSEFTTAEFVGMFTAVGLTMSSAGINVAHELGHRPERFHKWMSKLLLMPSQYCHFIIEHNLGHHKNVATPEDPATAKKGEILYFFWLRSIVFTYVNAWKLEMRRLKQIGQSHNIFINQMVQFLVLQVGFSIIIAWYFSMSTMIIYLAVAMFSVVMLETINYIEHYGLQRKKMDNGRYERVQPYHSWNSNHELGRILLYELTRHSDHHFLANKKYQLLDHHSNAKQLPVGYPSSMLLSMVPPLWFYIMNKRLA